MDILLPRPHSREQRIIVTAPGHVVALCGRRFGKTDGGIQRIFYWMCRDPGLYWWVGLTWGSASMKRAWRLLRNIARTIAAAIGVPEKSVIRLADHEIHLPGLGQIWLRSADNPSSLAGEGLKGVVMDEFTLMDNRVWEEYVEGTLLDYGGWACFLGVPKGPNWAAKLWADAAHLDGWTQVKAPSYLNPYIDHSAIERIKNRYGEHHPIFRQEYLAEIVSSGGEVFRHINRAIRAQPIHQARPLYSYVAGVDWARTRHETVISVIEVETKSLVHVMRMQNVDYMSQLNALAGLHGRFRFSTILAESNAMGGPQIEVAQAMGLPVIPFATTNTSKRLIVEKLALAFDTGEISIYEDPDLVGQLTAFQVVERSAGLDYSGPEDVGDDMVISLALAWHAAVDSHGLSTAGETLAKAFSLQ